MTTDTADRIPNHRDDPTAGPASRGTGRNPREAPGRPGASSLPGRAIPRRGDGSGAPTPDNRVTGSGSAGSRRARCAAGTGREGGDMQGRDSGCPPASGAGRRRSRVCSSSAPRRRRLRSSRSVSRRPTACRAAASATRLPRRAARRSASARSPAAAVPGRSASPGATAVITEAQSDPATDVKSVTVRPSTPQAVRGSRATGASPCTTGASTSSETLVTFVNQPAGGNYGSLKVCKLTETPGLSGPLVLVPGQRRPDRLDGGQRRLRRSGQLHLPHPGHLPGRLDRQRARADPGGHRGAVDRHRPR